MSDQLISREALKKDIDEIRWVNKYDLGKIIEIIDNAPTVEAFTKEDMAGAYNEGYACGSRENTRPQGEWIASPLGDYVCNKCSWVIGKFERNFCCNCGAKMKR